MLVITKFSRHCECVSKRAARMNAPRGQAAIVSDSAATMHHYRSKMHFDITKISIKAEYFEDDRTSPSLYTLCVCVSL